LQFFQKICQQRFNWLQKVADEIIKTYGSESNVKEIYDETWRLKRERPGKAIIFNQFGELINHLWHYEVTGSAMQSIYEAEKTEKSKLAGVCITSGSAGTLASGDYIKDHYQGAKLAVGEATDCSTLLNNGFGEHWIEGIGDKHIPWIHNVKNSDMFIGIDDADALRLFRLFNEPAGQEYMRSLGIKDDVIEKLTWVGVSGAANIIMAIKMAKYYEMTEDDHILTVLTDSAAMYQSRLAEMDEEFGKYSTVQAAVDHAVSALENDIDYVEELTYASKKRAHNLKYYTWIEQQEYDVDDLNAQWYDYDNYWG
jgi:cysteine synthase A